MEYPCADYSIPRFKHKWHKKAFDMIYCAYMGLTGVISVYVSAKFGRQRFMFAANKCDNINSSFPVNENKRNSRSAAVPAAVATVDDEKMEAQRVEHLCKLKSLWHNKSTYNLCSRFNISSSVHKFHIFAHVCLDSIPVSWGDVRSLIVSVDALRNRFHLRERQT